MANSKISALTSATTPLAGTEVVPIVQSSVTKQVSVENLVKATQPGSSANAVQYLNGSKVPTTSANFIYDGTNLVNGYTAAVVGVSGYTPTVQSITGDTNSSGFGVYGYTSGGVPRMQINRSKSTTKGTNTAVASGDNIGFFHYGGADGTGFIEAVRLTGQVDAAVSTNIVPGCYIISTMNTSGTMVESTRFSSNQYVGINTSATAARRLEVKQDGAVGLRLTNTTGGAGQGIEMLTASTKKSWLLGAQYNVDQAFEITPSTANGGTTFTTAATVFTATSIYPGADNTSSCGTSGNRWSVVYAATGTINTSDARAKTEVRSLSDAETKAAIDLANEIGIYQFLDAVQAKGDAARLHCGLTVQRAIEIMQAHGLDPMRYGFICYDEWLDQYKDYVINEGETITKTVKVQRQKTMSVLRQVQSIEMINGVATLVSNQVEMAENVYEQHPVFDLDGNAVMTTQNDEDGLPQQVQLMYHIPVMEEIEMEVEEDAPPKYESRLIQSAGNKYGFRPDELTLFILKGLASQLS